MTEINLEECTEFGKILDIWSDNTHDKAGLNEFVNNVVMNNNYGNGHSKMLQDLSNIWVLVSKKNFPFENLTITQKINQEIPIELSEKKNLVLGYIWLCPWVLKNEGCIPYHFINFIDSRISGLNISKYMIERYEEVEEDRNLLPFEVMSGAEKYWKKYFMDVYGINNKNELRQMITDFQFKPGDIRWEDLFRSFEMS